MNTQTTSTLDPITSSNDNTANNNGAKPTTCVTVPHELSLVEAITVSMKIDPNAMIEEPLTGYSMLAFTNEPTAVIEAFKEYAGKYYNKKEAKPVVRLEVGRKK